MSYETFDADVLLADTQRTKKIAGIFSHTHRLRSLMKSSLLHHNHHRVKALAALSLFVSSCCAVLSSPDAHPIGSLSLNDPCRWSVRLVHYQCNRAELAKVKKTKKRKKEKQEGQLLLRPDSCCFELLCSPNRPNHCNPHEALTCLP